MPEETLTDLIKKQIKIEKGLVTTIKKEVEGTHNVAAKLLLLEVQMDSEKHAMILEGILDVIGHKDAKPLWDTLIESYVDKLVVKKNLENHIKTEEAMLEHIQREVRETKDEGIKLLLEHIASDEKKHHEILQTVIREAYKIRP